MAINNIQDLLAAAGTGAPGDPALTLQLLTRSGLVGSGADTQSLVQAVAGGTSGSSAADELARQMADLRDQVSNLATIGARQSDSIDRNTAATDQNTTAKSGGGNAGLDLLKNQALDRFGLGGLVGPLISGIAGLFGGGSNDAPPALVKDVEPTPVRVDLALPSAGASSFQETRQSTDGLTQRVPSMPAVTVTVNAIDSRSFLDHSDAIARAVRDAMLNTHSLNDVVSDL